MIITLFQAKAQDINYITKSGKYYWGQGYSDNERIADKQAIENFINEITKQLKDKFLQVNKSQKTTLDEYTKTALKSYSNTSFKGLNTKADRDATSILTIRYIEKENLNSLFQNRKEKILNYYNEAIKAEKEVRISDALQKYYWSLLLLYTHPDNQSIYVKKDEMSINLIDFLPSKINQILNEVMIKNTEVKFDQEHKSYLITNGIFYQEQPVQNLYYKIWKGNAWSNLTGCKNGIGVIELSDSFATTTDTIQVQTEYTFESDAGIDNELVELFGNINIPVFKTALKKIDNPVKKANLPANPSGISHKMNNVNISPVGKVPEQIDSIIYLIVKSVESKNIQGMKNYFTNEGWNDFNYMIGYGNARLFSNSLQLDAIKINDEYVVRKVPMYFKFSANNKEFVEDLVFYLNADLKVSGLSFSISDIAINDILNKKEEWGSIQDKYQLIQFVENYKTAYCFKRLDYIEKVFDDNALIIVGRSLVNAPVNTDRNIFQLYNNEQIEYIQKSKESYLKSLETVFKSNEYINIHFEDNTVKRARENDKIFGIQIAQYYTSVNYSDKGYLFLMVDLNDSLNPKIYVRTWQPQKNPDGSVIGLQDFNF